MDMGRGNPVMGRGHGLGTNRSIRNTVMVVKPTVPKEDRDEVLHRACSRLSAKVTAYPACRPGPVVGHR